MKYYIIAGEASGDLHGSNLIKELKKVDASSTFRCWGGDKMKEAGGDLVKHYRDLAFMGFTDVVMNLRTIFKNLKFCKEDILQHKPDAIVLIDYPGFNLRITKWAKQQRLKGTYTGKIIYYISPQVWAWKASRVKMMKECIDKMLVILPFEKEYFKNKWNWEVEYVGHPLVEEVERYSLNVDSHKPLISGTGPQSTNIVALLPGSRKQEILLKLPIMLEVTKSFLSYHFIVAKAPGVEEAFYDTLLKNHPNVSYVANKTYDVLLQSKAALVTSGTATLETALFGVPEVVCYKGSFLSYQIGKRLVNVKYISLVNLIMDKLVVKELLQEALTAKNLIDELTPLLGDEKRIAGIKNDYAALKKLLSEGGNASTKAATSITNYLSQ